MSTTGWGRILTVSSMHELRASPFKSAYVRTPLVHGQVADQAKAHGIPESEVVETVMLAPMAPKRLIGPSEVAAFASLLCPSDADSITGASLTMDGGRTAH